MKVNILSVCVASLVMTSPLAAADLESWRPNKTEPVLAEATDLASFRWAARPIVIIADSDENLYYREQLAILDAAPEAVEDRDIVIVVDTRPELETDLREQLEPGSFGVYLIGKDGTLKLQSDTPVEMARFNEIIDSMPMRRRELEEENSLNLN